MVSVDPVASAKTDIQSIMGVAVDSLYAQSLLTAYQNTVAAQTAVLKLGRVWTFAEWLRALNPTA